MKTKSLSITKLLSAAFGLVMLSTTASASVIFDSGLPSGWDCTGTCGVAGADGDITSSPFSGNYGWVATTNGVLGLGLPGLEGNTGSMLRSSLFAAAEHDDLKFYFNYVTSDGAGFADYAWARLLDESYNQVAMLFTARTLSSGTIVPGLGMPAPEATLNPGTVSIINGAPTWSPLGASSADCYASGCGYTGWIESTFQIAAAGNYFLEFGAVNWTDSAYDSGLAFDGITVGGVQVGVPSVSEPGTLLMFGLALTFFARRKFKA